MGETPVIDMAFAMEQTMDDIEFLKELLVEMVGEEETKVEEMFKAVREDDHEGLQGVAHYIKGAAANLGLTSLCDASTQLDALGKELIDGDMSRELAQRVADAFAALREYTETKL